MIIIKLPSTTTTCTASLRSEGETKREASNTEGRRAPSELVHKVNLRREAVKNRFHPAEKRGERFFLFFSRGGWISPGREPTRRGRGVLCSRVACIHPVGHPLYPLYVNDADVEKGAVHPSKNLISPSTRVNTENTCCRLMNFHS